MDLVRLQMHINRNVNPYYDCIVNNAQYMFIMYYSCNKLGRAVSLILIIALLLCYKQTDKHDNVVFVMTMQCTIAIPYNEVNFTSTELAVPVEYVYSCFSCALLIFQNLVGYKRDVVEARSQYISFIEHNIRWNYHFYRNVDVFVKATINTLFLNDNIFLCNRSFIALCWPWSGWKFSAVQWTHCCSPPLLCVWNLSAGWAFV